METHVVFVCWSSKYLLDTLPFGYVENASSVSGSWSIVRFFWQKISILSGLILLRGVVLSYRTTVSRSSFMKYSDWAFSSWDVWVAIYTNISVTSWNAYNASQTDFLPLMEVVMSQPENECNIGNALILDPLGLSKWHWCGKTCNVCPSQRPPRYRPKVESLLNRRMYQQGWQSHLYLQYAQGYAFPLALRNGWSTWTTNLVYASSWLKISLDVFEPNLPTALSTVTYTRYVQKTKFRC